MSRETTKSCPICGLPIIFEIDEKYVQCSNCIGICEVIKNLKGIELKRLN